MRFHYIASDQNGKATEGFLDAPNPAEVLEWMVKQGLRPVSIKPAEESGVKKLLKVGSRQKVSIEDKVFLVKYLALMLRVGTDLFRAVDILIADFKNPSMRALLTEMRESLSRGQPFYTTFERYPRLFSNVFTNLIKAGETSGHLDEVLDKLSVDLGKQYELRNKIKSSLIYPVVLVVIALVILFFMVSVVLPRIANTFASGLGDPPTFSKVVFAVGFFFNKYMIPVLGGVMLLGSGVFFYFRRSVRGKKILFRILYRMPVLKDVLLKISLQRFATTFSSLLSSGTPILEALEITAGAVGNIELRDALLRISRDGVSKGLTIGEAFKKETYFPQVVVNLIAISEQSGHIEEVLDTLAQFYESEIDASVKGLVSFIEPALLIFIGIIVGTIALAIIVPIYQLVGGI